MKVELGDKNTFRSKEVWRSAGAEFVATLLFVFIGCGSVVATGMLAPGLDSARLVAIAVAHGLAIALLAGATGAISGGHINPAVTVAFVVAGKENLIRASVYIGAQLLGGIFGAALLDMCTPGHFVGGLGSHSLGHGVNAGQGLVMEVMLTFILVFTIFGVAVDRRGPGVIAPLPIGFAVLVDHLVGVPYTGTCASMNPARSFGPALVSGSFTSAHWIYWFGPCIGAALAAFVYKHIFLQAPIVPMVQDQKPEKKVVLSA
ncbi:aquaporin [Klebsormidium nitens]|uniref:Aquaporin n=1 Tax=Klebsormidium nitens TaxID=105231 RepID=A0A1Y1HUC1_KLENI|nr:aquaporin [Klebsormidium nitens]|eukprot:GAQ81723.1 aquaporin [Klebsormidium nitens]